MELSNTFVVHLGLGIVFFGLICIVFLCKLMSFVCQSFVQQAPPTPVNPSPAPLSTDTIPNRQEFIAAVSSVIAEELNTDVTGIKILSVKKL